MSDDRRLIEDFLPIQAISAEASRERILCIGNPILKLGHVKRNIVAVRFYEIPAETNKALVSMVEKGRDK